MNNDGSHDSKPPTPHQLAHLRDTGQLTPEDVLAMESGDQKQVEGVMRSVRMRHAKARLDAAVGAGTISEAEAADLIDQVARGKHAKALRRRINTLTRHGKARSEPGE